MSGEQFKDAVRRLHGEKSAAYGVSWKRRGELISVLANIARKVDRVEQISSGGPITRDESLVDTAVDLLVYSIKYQTFLADQDTQVAAYLFHAPGKSFSEGTAGFEELFRAIDFGLLDAPDTPTLVDASIRVGEAFANLERCFSEPSAPSEVFDRLHYAMALTDSAIALVAAVRSEAPESYAEFLRVWETS